MDERNRKHNTFLYFCWPRRRAASISIGHMPSTDVAADLWSGKSRSLVPRCLGPASERCCCSFQKPAGVGAMHTTIACWNICTCVQQQHTQTWIVHEKNKKNHKQRKQSQCSAVLSVFLVWCSLFRCNSNTKVRKGKGAHHAIETRSWSKDVSRVDIFKLSQVRANNNEGAGYS